MAKPTLSDQVSNISKKSVSAIGKTFTPDTSAADTIKNNEVTVSNQTKVSDKSGINNSNSTQIWMRFPNHIIKKIRRAKAESNIAMTNLVYKFLNDNGFENWLDELISNNK